MNEMGPSPRLLCDAKCIVIFELMDYPGVIENVSLTGALIKLIDETPDNIQPGDRCELMLCSNPDLYPVKYTCNVIRRDSAFVGVQFVKLNLI